MFKYWRRFDTNGVREWAAQQLRCGRIYRGRCFGGTSWALSSNWTLSLWHPAEHAPGAKAERTGLGLKFPDAPGKGWWFICLHFPIPSLNLLANNLFRNSDFLCFKLITLALASSHLSRRTCVKSLTLALVQSKFSSHGGSLFYNLQTLA